MKNLKIVKDFGVTAWIATLIVIGSFVLLIKGVDHDLLAMIGQWVSAVISAVVVLKAVGNNTNSTPPPTPPEVKP